MFVFKLLNNSIPQRLILLRLTSLPPIHTTLTESLTQHEVIRRRYPGHMEVEERVMEHKEMIYNLSAAMDRVVQNMGRWEIQKVFPAPPPAQSGCPLSAPFP